MRIETVIDLDLFDIKEAISECSQEEYRDLINYMIENLDDYDNFLVNEVEDYINDVDSDNIKKIIRLCEEELKTRE